MKERSADGDPLDDLIESVRRQRKPGVPLYVTAAKVFGKAADEIDPWTFDSLAFTGHRAILDAGTVPSTPEGQQLFPSEAMDRLGTEYDESDLSTEEEARLAFVGFVTLIGEALMQSDAEN